MILKKFIDRMRKRILDRRAQHTPRSTGKLRVTRLEDRKLLDAGFGVGVGGILTLDGFESGDSLTADGDLAAGNGVFELTSGIWNPSGGGGGFTLSNSDRTLTVSLGAGAISGLNIDGTSASAGQLANVRSSIGLTVGSLNIADVDDVNFSTGADDVVDSVSVTNVSSLTLTDANDINIAALTASGDVTISSVSGNITDIDGTTINVGGHAEFTADNITLGDDAAGTTNFGSLTFSAVGSVDITEDSATELAGDIDAGTLTLTTAGALTSADATTIDVTNGADLEADSIVLQNNTGGRTVNFGSVQFSAAGDVVLHENTGIHVSADSGSVSGDVTLNADGDLSMAGGVTLSGDHINLTSNETTMDVGDIGSNANPFTVDGNTLVTFSNGDQVLAVVGEINSFDLDSIDNVDVPEGLDAAGTTGAVTLQSGTLILDAPRNVVGDLTIAAGATLTGTGNVGDVTFADGAVLDVDLTGPIVDAEYDQLNVSGNVMLAGTLNIKETFTPAHGTQFTIVSNPGGTTSGTFDGLAEGATVVGGSGHRFSIRYVDSDGDGNSNDVVLTALTPVYRLATTAAMYTHVENTAGGTATITVERTGDLSIASSVVVAVNAGSATAGDDFAGGLQTVAFDVGETSKTFDVAIVNDQIVEADETIQIVLVAPKTGALLGANTSETLTIVDEDSATLSIADNLTINEGDGTATFTINSSAASQKDLTVGVSLNHGTTSGSDVVLSAATATISGDGTSTSTTVTVLLTDDQRLEGNEAFSLTISNPLFDGAADSARVTSGDATADGLIADNETATLTFSAASSDVDEDTTTHNIQSTLSLSTTGTGTAGLDRSISFDVAVTAATATDVGANADYSYATKTVTFAAGRDGDVFEDDATITIHEDALDDDSETIQLSLTAISDGSGGQLSTGTTQHTVTINDDDAGTSGTIDLTAGAGDVLVLANGANLEIYVGGTLFATRAVAGFEALVINGTASDEMVMIDASSGTFNTAIEFNGGDGADTLRVINPTTGVYRPTGGITFHGNAGNDTLELFGGAANSVEHRFVNNSDGSVLYDGATTVTYTGLAPVIDTITATTRAFSFTGGAESIVLSDDGTAGDNMSLIDSTLGESVTFLTATTSVTINTESAGGSGADLVSVQGVDAAWAADLIINGGNDDTVTFETTSTTISSGDLSVTANNINVNAALVVSDGSLTIDANSAFATTAAITGNGGTTSLTAGTTAVVNNTIDGTNDLTLNVTGSTTFNAAVGATTAVGDGTGAALTINSAGATVFESTVRTANGIVQNDAAGTVTFQQDVTVTGGGEATAFDGSVILAGLTFSSAGDITFGNANADTVSTSSAPVVVSTTNNGRVTFNAATSLGSDLTINSGTGDVAFNGTIDGGFRLTVDGGSGNVRFAGAVGGANRLTGLVVDGANVDFDGTVNVDSAGLDVDASGLVSFDAGVSTTNGGTVTLSNGEIMTLAAAADFTLDGAFIQDGLGGVSTAADIITTGDTVSFAAAVTQTGAVLLDNTNSGSHPAGADLTLNSVTGNANNLTLNAGSGGAISSGQIAGVDALRISDSATANFFDTVSATTVAIADTSTAVTFDGAVTATNLTAAAAAYGVTFNAGGTIANAVTFNNVGGVTFGNDISDVINFAGGITSTASTTTIQGTLNTTAADVTLADTTLAAATTINTGAAGGTITAGQVSGSGIALTLSAGAGDVSLTNAANVIGDLIVNAAVVTITEADQITQSAAWTTTGATTLNAGGNNIILSDAANEFGTLNLTAANATINENTDLAVGVAVVAANITLTSAGSINDASTDSVTDITAMTVDLNAATGIGDVAALEIASGNISADTTSGNIDIDNVLGSTATVGSLTTGVGAIAFDQSGGASVNFGSVATSDGSINLQNTGGDLNVDGAVAAGGSGNVSLTTATAGDVILTGTVTAMDNAVTMNSADQIIGDTTNMAADIVADRVNLNAVNGIGDGAGGAIETTINILAVNNTARGDVNISNTQALNLNDVSNTAGSVEICVAAGHLTLTGLLNAGTNTVRLQADAGSVLESGAGRITAGQLGVRALSNVTLAANTNNVDTFAAIATTGSVTFNEADGFIVGTVSAGDCVAEVVGITTPGSGDITVRALLGTIQIDNAIAASHGNIDLTANVVNQNDDITTPGTGTIAVTADTGSITMLDGSQSTTDSGAIVYHAAADVLLSQLSSAAGAVHVTATGGSILDNSIAEGGGSENILATTATLIAAADIGGTEDLDIAVNTLNANSTVSGSVRIAETDAVTLDSVTTANGDINIEAATDVTATSVTATTGSVEINAIAGDVNIDIITANGPTVSGIAVDISAGRNIVDSNGGALNIQAANGVTRLEAGSDIGVPSTNVFKPTLSDPLEIRSAEVEIVAAGNVAVHETGSGVVTILTADSAFLSSAGDLNLSGASVTTNTLSLEVTGLLTLPPAATPLTVTNDLRIDAGDVAAAGTGVIELIADRLLFKSGQSEEITVTVNAFDGQTTGDLTVNSVGNMVLTDLDCDRTAINVGSNIAVLNSTTTAQISQVLPSDLSQNSRILAGSLVLNGQGTFDLTNADNDTGILAGNTTGDITYTDLNDITVDTVNIVTNTSSTVNGLTSGGDIQVDVGTTLTINQQLSAAVGDIRLQSFGNMTQSESGIIMADRLGIHQRATAGVIQLAAQNDVNIFAANNAAAGGAITFADRDEVTIGELPRSEVSDSTFEIVTGLQTNNGNITVDTGLPAAGTNSILLAQEINAGTAAVRLIADGDISQTTEGTIIANELGIRQQANSGNIVLDDANAVQKLATFNAANGGLTAFKNTQSLLVGSVAALDVAAAPTSNAVRFADTNGIVSTNGDTLLDIDGVLTLNQQLNVGTADARLRTDGSVTQSADGRIIANELGIRQQANSGNIQLGTAANDIDIIAAENAAVGGDIVFFDADSLTVSEVAVQTLGNLTFNTTTGVDTNAGDINVTSEGDLVVERNINAAHETLTTSIDESITLISRNGNFTLADNTVITSDENPTVGIFDDVTLDSVTIIAGSSGSNGTVNLGNNIEVRTDGGVAKQVAPRPTAFATAGTVNDAAFVSLADAENSRSNLTFIPAGFLGVLDLVIGVAGEENLEIVIDWGAISQTNLTEFGPAGNAAASTGTPGALEFSVADGDKAVFYIDEGGQQYLIPHIYAVGDLNTTPNDRNGRELNPNIFGVRFSVAQHASINIWGSDAIDPTTGTADTAPADFSGTSPTLTDATGTPINPAATSLALLSSTDTNNLNRFRQQAAELPLLNDFVTTTGRPVGLAEWEFIAGPSPGLVLIQPTARPTLEIPRIEAPFYSPVVSEVINTLNFSAGASSDAAIGTEVYLQVRRYFELDAEAEVVIPRITDSEFISNRESFETFVEENPELQDGAGYEVWLITETGGQRVERPILKFEITGGRPGPATEVLPETFEPYELQELEFEQPAEDDHGSVEPNPDENTTSAVNSVDDKQLAEEAPANTQPPKSSGVAAAMLLPTMAFSRAARWTRQQTERQPQLQPQVQNQLQNEGLSRTARTLRRLREAPSECNSMVPTAKRRGAPPCDE